MSNPYSSINRAPKGPHRHTLQQNLYSHSAENSLPSKFSQFLDNDSLKNFLPYSFSSFKSCSHKLGPCQCHSEEDLMEKGSLQEEDYRFKEKSLLHLWIDRDMLLNLLLIICFLNSFK